MKKLLLLLLLIPLIGVGQSKKKQLNSPYKLSKGIIDHRLFTFINSDNFYKDGTEDLQKMINLNNIKIDSITVEDLNEFGGCGCCDMYQYWNEDILYFNEGKVLIIEKHYDGDWESIPEDWYNLYLYCPIERKFKIETGLSSVFLYNYQTDYYIEQYNTNCDDMEPFYLIYNNQLDNVGQIWPEGEGYYGNYDFYWNEKDNEIIFKEDGKFVFRVFENNNKKWIIE